MRAVRPFDDEAELHALVLHRLLLKTLGPAYLTWDAEPLHLEIVEHWGSCGTVTFEKVLAVRVLLANTMFWTEWGVFEKVVAAFAGQFPDFSMMQPPEAGDVAAAVWTAAVLRGDAPAYGEDVTGYIAAACVNDGLWFLETPLDFANDAVTYLAQQRGVTLPRSEVAALLAKQRTTYEKPASVAEAQVNEVLNQRADFAAFQREVADQTRRFVPEG